MSQSPELAKTIPAQPVPSSPPASLGASRRSTVLPRVQLDGPVPSLTQERRERFEELKPLGRGGMGEVVLLQDHDIERSVALKRLPAQADLGTVLRFVEEIRTVGSLEHPNIVPVHDVGLDEQGRYFFVMKHLRGDTLEQIIDKLRAGDAATHQRFDFAMRLQLFLGVLNAVGYAHERGILHRDLKPANIMVGPFGEVTVMDWGLAKRLDRPELPAPPAGPAAPEARTSSPREPFATQAGEIIGTPYYMSPEQARGAQDQVDRRTDTYALAVIFHELMFLEHYLEPRERLDEILQGVQTVKPPVFRVVRRKDQPVVPSEHTWFVERGLEKDPAKRFQTVQEMAEVLKRGLGGRVSASCPRTAIKATLQAVIRASDAHPYLGLTTLVVIGGLGVGTLLRAIASLF